MVGGTSWPRRPVLAPSLPPSLPALPALPALPPSPGEGRTRRLEVGASSESRVL